MDELFNMLSSSARLKKKKKSTKNNDNKKKRPFDDVDVDVDDEGEGEDDGVNTTTKAASATAVFDHNHSDNNNNKDHWDEKKRLQVHKEQVAAFRRSMCIRVSNKHDPALPDPISSFQELQIPKWWNNNTNNSAKNNDSNNNNKNEEIEEKRQQLFVLLYNKIRKNIELGKWKEPTPIQMQAIPSLLSRRDVIGAAPTGSGKSGAFIIPSLLVSRAPFKVFYGLESSSSSSPATLNSSGKKKIKKKKKSANDDNNNRQGEIRVLLLAPSLELAAQLHREVQRLGGMELPGGSGSKSSKLTSILLSKSNAAHVIAGSVGGKRGLDVLVATPLRLVDCIEKGMKLNTVRVVVLDEADRLLDAADGSSSSSSSSKVATAAAVKKDKRLTGGSKDDSSDDEESDDENDEEEDKLVAAETHQAVVAESGSSQTRTFLAQMDIILSEVPATAVRALFSATVTPTVRSLGESILRNPVDITIRACNNAGPGGANPDIDQELMFVGREEGKLLAMRQLAQRGQLHPPAIVFVQSQDRAQALFGELLYDGMHVDVIHAGRSKSARENAVAKFRRGDTWVLICTDLVARGVDFRAVNMVINYDLPDSGITYVHRVGRTGRAGRKGKAITLFTEADFDNLRTIANIMKQSGCKVEDWMLNMPKSSGGRKQRQNHHGPQNNKKRGGREGIDTTPKYDKRKRHKRQQMIEQSKAKKHHAQDANDDV